MSMMILKIAPLLLLLLLLSSTSAAEPELLWSDEFDGTGDIDAASWTARIGNNGGWGNGELQSYTAGAPNLAVVSDNLEITVVKKPDEETGDIRFSSARIDTAQKVLVKYGTVSARIKVPDVDAGLWPAFWTMGGQDLEWPANGEMNIMEVGQGQAINDKVANQRVVSAAHWESNDKYATYAGSTDLADSLNEDYNIFTLDWTPSSITTYVNDILVWTMDIDDVSCLDCEEFHWPHYIILNVAVGGGFTSGGSSSSAAGCGSSSSSSGEGCGAWRTPDDITATLPATMLVDWVRIYDNGHTELTVTKPSIEDTLAPVAATTGLAAPVTAPVAVPDTAPVTAPVTAPSAIILPPVVPATSPTDSSVPDSLPNFGGGSSKRGKSGGKSGKSGKGGSSSDTSSAQSDGSSGKSASKKGSKGSKGSSSSSSSLESLSANSGAARGPRGSSTVAAVTTAAAACLAAQLF